MGSFPSKPASEAVTSPACPRGLMRLPNELLLEITQHLTTTRDVYALLRVNRRLAILLPHVLSAMLLHIYTRRTRHTLFSPTTTNAESLVFQLLSNGIDLDATVCNCDIPGYEWCRCAPPIHRAITHSNTGMVKILLRHGASITSRCISTGRNAVHHAIHTTDLNSGHFRIARDNDLAILQKLLSGGRLKHMNDAAALSASGESWLNTAVRTCPRSSVTLVMPFLVRGLDVNVADAAMLTPLHIAVLNNRPDLAKMLLQRGAKHRRMDSRGRTPWSIACNRPNCELIDLLLSRDAGLIGTAVNASGETAEVCLQRKLDSMIADEQHESEYWLREVRERTEMTVKLRKLARLSRKLVGVRPVLQVYYFGM